MLSSSSRNSALGNIKINSDNVSSIFDAPLSFKDNKQNIYFSYNNEFDGLIEIIHLGYNIHSSFLKFYNEKDNLILHILLIYH